MMTKLLVRQHPHLPQNLATLVCKIPRTLMSCKQMDGKNFSWQNVKSKIALEGILPLGKS